MSNQPPCEQNSGAAAGARAILDHYTEQPSRMPHTVRDALSQAAGGEPIQLYALADLSEQFTLTEDWVGLTEGHLACGDQAHPLSDIDKVEEENALGCNVLHVIGKSGGRLATFRFTHRQRTAMGNLRYLLEERLAGRPGETADADDAYAIGASEPIRKVQSSVTVSGRSVLWRLISYLRPYRGKVILGMVSATLLAALSMVPAALSGRLIDTVEAGLRTGDGAFREQAGFFVLLIVIAYVLRLVFLWLRLHLMAILGEQVAHDLRNEVYAKVQKLSVSYFSKNQTGTIISRITSDTDRIWEFIAFGVVEVSLSLITLVAASVFLIWKDMTLGLVMVIPVPFLLWAIAINGLTIQRHYTRAWRKWSSLTDVISDTIPGMRIVKSFHREDHERARFGKKNADSLDTFVGVHRNWTRFWPLLMAVIHGITIAVYWLALPRLFAGPDSANHLSTGDFVTFLLFAGIFFQPIEVFGQMSRMVNRSLSSAQRVFELIDTKPEMLESRESIDPGRVEGRVTFEAVSFGYDRVRPILKDISFEVQPGETIGIVGTSGAGKTTLTNLLPRFYDPTSGRICVDGHDLRDLDTGKLRRQIGMVLQEPFLFHGSILDNIRYGKPEATSAEVIEAARAADAHRFITRLPQAYDTVVGERGHTLSGGERQRIAIARAVLSDPRILILDEATSAVDSETEFKIQAALDRLSKDRTTFAIAHRLSTLRNADRILVLDQGRLAETGSHEELLEIGDGIYRKLWETQQRMGREDQDVV